MSWPTTLYNGTEYYLFDGVTLIPVDPSTGAAILMLRPQGGMGVGIPPIADGAPGAAAAFVEGPIAFTELDPGDPTPAGFTITEVSPGLYAMSGQMHSGADGAPSVNAIDLSTIGGAKAVGKLIRVNAAQTGFDFAFEKVGDSLVPTTDGLFNTTAGTSNSTVGIVSISARNTDVRVRARGYQIIRQSGGADVRVDFVARLNGETGGNIISKCQGLGGTERLHLVDARPAGSAASWDTVAAGNTATVHFRTEQQGGANNYTTSKTECLFVVDLLPV